jgi:nucleotide-binding universal stress UspA family protein
MIFLKKILVTTDLSAYSLAAVEYAASFGTLYASRLYLLLVIDKKEGHHVREANLHFRSEREAQEALEEFAKTNLPPELRMHLIVRTGAPTEGILRFAEEEGIDLIVMATHGHTGLRHIMMGNVTEKVVRHSHVPVLTVKPRPLRENDFKDEDVEQELHLRSSDS